MSTVWETTIKNVKCTFTFMSVLQGLKAQLEHARAGLSMTTAYPAYQKDGADAYLAAIHSLHRKIAAEERGGVDVAMLSRVETAEIKRKKEVELEESMLVWFTAYLNDVVKTGSNADSVFRDEYAGNGAQLHASRTSVKGVEGIYLQQFDTYRLFPMFDKCVLPVLVELGYTRETLTNDIEWFIPL